MNKKQDIALRAVKTFFQAFFAAWLISGAGMERNVLLGAFAAGISAVWNAFIL